MPRPARCRRICCEPAYDRFIPGGIAGGEAVTLSVDEYESIRLIDYEKKTQLEAAHQMDIARTTVTAIYEAARKKIADALINGRPLLIGGGSYRLCGGDGCPGCPKAKDISAKKTIAPLPERKGDIQMRIAVTFENGNVFQHFGHTSLFKVYDIEDGKIAKEFLAPTMGSGHGALAGFLKTLSVDALICGGIGGGAINALSDAGIRVCAGVQGNTDEAVKALLLGTLDFSDNANCNHHGEGHTCGHHEEGHNCGEGHCGK